ncbi:hypothetical protein K9L27_00745 [Candidatus Gracilibacteria bacterium]|nr:hypothetical protein [Candidatus Gracilibacteria bacterium]
MKKISFVFGVLLTSEILFGCGAAPQRASDNTQKTPPVQQGEVVDKAILPPTTKSDEIKEKTTKETEKTSLLDSLKNALSSDKTVEEKEDSPDITPAPQDIPTEEEAISYDDGETCRNEGGSWIRGQNAERSYLCLKPYPDAGKSCENSEDCYGKCLGRMNPDTKEYEGYCQKNNNPYGCFVEMKKGKAQDEACVN